MALLLGVGFWLTAHFQYTVPDMVDEALDVLDRHATTLAVVRPDWALSFAGELTGFHGTLQAPDQSQQALDRLNRLTARFGQATSFATSLPEDWRQGLAPSKIVEVEQAIELIRHRWPLAQLACQLLRAYVQERETLLLVSPIEVPDQSTTASSGSRMVFSYPAFPSENPKQQELIDEARWFDPKQAARFVEGIHVLLGLQAVRTGNTETVGLQPENMSRLLVLISRDAAQLGLRPVAFTKAEKTPNRAGTVTSPLPAAWHRYGWGRLRPQTPVAHDLAHHERDVIFTEWGLPVPHTLLELAEQPLVLGDKAPTPPAASEEPAPMRGIGVLGLAGIAWLIARLLAGALGTYVDFQNLNPEQLFTLFLAPEGPTTPLKLLWASSISGIVELGLIVAGLRVLTDEAKLRPATALPQGRFAAWLMARVERIAASRAGRWIALLVTRRKPGGLLPGVVADPTLTEVMHYNPVTWTIRAHPVLREYRFPLQGFFWLHEATHAAIHILSRGRATGTSRVAHTGVYLLPLGLVLGLLVAPLLPGDWTVAAFQGAGALTAGLVLAGLAAPRLGPRFQSGAALLRRWRYGIALLVALAALLLMLLVGNPAAAVLVGVGIDIVLAVAGGMGEPSAPLRDDPEGRPLTIVEFMSSDPKTVGGTQRHLQDLHRAMLAQRPMRIHVFYHALTPSPASEEAIGQGTVIYHPLPLPTAWERLRPWRIIGQRLGAMTDIARQEPIDLIHSHSPFHTVVSWPASLRLGVPHVVTAHSGSRWRKRPVASLLVSLLTPLMKATGSVLLGLSRAAADTLASSAEVIGSGVDVAFFHPGVGDAAAFRSRWHLDPEAPIIFHAARMVPAKGQHHLLAVAQQLRARGIPAQVVLMGPADDPAYVARLKQDVETQELSAWVRVLPAGDPAEVRDGLAAAAMVVLPTKYPEGLPRELLEAAAMAAPMIAYPAGGVTEVVRDGETGFLVRQGDIAALTDRVQQLLQDPMLAQRLGRRARAFVEEFATLDGLAQRHLALYDQLIKNPPPTKAIAEFSGGLFGAMQQFYEQWGGWEFAKRTGAVLLVGATLAASGWQAALIIAPLVGAIFSGSLAGYRQKYARYRPRHKPMREVPFDVIQFKNDEMMSHDDALDCIKKAQAALRDRGQFVFALAGGDTRRRTYQLLATQYYDLIVDDPQGQLTPQERHEQAKALWRKGVLFLGDEQGPGTGTTGANERMVQETLLNPRWMPADGRPEFVLFNHDGKAYDSPEAFIAHTKRYTHEKQTRIMPRADGWVRFDHVMLGAGTKGNLGSWFSGGRAMRRKAPGFWAEAREGQWRMALTLQEVEDADSVSVSVTGTRKRWFVARFLRRYDVGAKEEYETARDEVPARVLLDHPHPERVKVRLDEAALSWEPIEFDRQDGKKVRANIRWGLDAQGNPDPHGPVVILVHGFMGRGTWELQMAELPAHYTVVDLRHLEGAEELVGEALADYGALSIEAAVRYFATQHPTRKITLAGHSMASYYIKRLYSRVKEFPGVGDRVTHVIFTNAFARADRFRAIANLLTYVFIRQDVPWPVQAAARQIEYALLTRRLMPRAQVWRDQLVIAFSWGVTKMLVGLAQLFLLLRGQEGWAKLLASRLDAALDDAGVPLALRPAITVEDAQISPIAPAHEMGLALTFPAASEEAGERALRESGAQILVMAAPRDPLTGMASSRASAHRMSAFFVRFQSAGERILGSHRSHMIQPSDWNRTARDFINGPPANPSFPEALGPVVAEMLEPDGERRAFLEANGFDTSGLGFNVVQGLTITGGGAGGGRLSSGAAPRPSLSTRLKRAAANRRLRQQWRQQQFGVPLPRKRRPTPYFSWWFPIALVGAWLCTTAAAWMPGQTSTPLTWHGTSSPLPAVAAAAETLPSNKELFDQANRWEAAGAHDLAVVALFAAMLEKFATEDVPEILLSSHARLANARVRQDTLLELLMLFEPTPGLKNDEVELQSDESGVIVRIEAPYMQQALELVRRWTPKESRQARQALVDQVSNLLHQQTRLVLQRFRALERQRPAPTLTPSPLPRPSPTPTHVGPKKPSPHDRHVPDDADAVASTFFRSHRLRAGVALLFGALAMARVTRAESELKPGQAPGAVKNQFGAIQATGPAQDQGDVIGVGQHGPEPQARRVSSIIQHLRENLREFGRQLRRLAGNNPTDRSFLPTIHTQRRPERQREQGVGRSGVDQGPVGFSPTTRRAEAHTRPEARLEDAQRRTGGGLKIERAPDLEGQAHKDEPLSLQRGGELLASPAVARGPVRAHALNWARPPQSSYGRTLPTDSESVSPVAGSGQKPSRIRAESLAGQGAFVSALRSLLSESTISPDDGTVKIVDESAIHGEYDIKSGTLVLSYDPQISPSRSSRGGRWPWRLWDRLPLFIGIIAAGVLTVKGGAWLLPAGTAGWTPLGWLAVSVGALAMATSGGGWWDRWMTWWRQRRPAASAGDVAQATTDEPNEVVLTMSRRRFLQLAGSAAAVRTLRPSPLLAVLAGQAGDTVLVPAAVVPELFIPYLNPARLHFLKSFFGQTVLMRTELRIGARLGVVRGLADRGVYELAKTFLTYFEQDPSCTVVPTPQEVEQLLRFFAPMTSRIQQRAQVQPAGALTLSPQDTDLLEALEETRRHGRLFAEHPLVRAQEEALSIAGQDTAAWAPTQFAEIGYRLAEMHDALRSSQGMLDYLARQIPDSPALRTMRRLLEEGPEFLPQDPWFQAMRARYDPAAGPVEHTASDRAASVSTPASAPAAAPEVLRSGAGAISEWARGLTRRERARLHRAERLARKGVRLENNFGLADAGLVRRPGVRHGVRDTLRAPPSRRASQRHLSRNGRRIAPSIPWKGGSEAGHYDRTTEPGPQFRDAKLGSWARKKVKGATRAKPQPTLSSLLDVLRALIQQGYDLTLSQEALGLVGKNTWLPWAGTLGRVDAWTRQELYHRVRRLPARRGHPTKYSLLEDGLWDRLPDAIRRAIEHGSTDLYGMFEPDMEGRFDLSPEIWDRLPWRMQVYFASRPGHGWRGYVRHWDHYAPQNKFGEYSSQPYEIERRQKLSYVLARLIPHISVTERQLYPLVRPLTPRQLDQFLQTLEPVAAARALTLEDIRRTAAHIQQMSGQVATAIPRFSGGRWPWLQPFYQRLSKRFGPLVGEALAPTLIEGTFVVLTTLLNAFLLQRWTPIASPFWLALAGWGLAQLAWHLLHLICAPGDTRLQQLQFAFSREKLLISAGTGLLVIAGLLGWVPLEEARSWPLWLISSASYPHILVNYWLVLARILKRPRAALRRSGGAGNLLRETFSAPRLQAAGEQDRLELLAHEGPVLYAGAGELQFTSVRELVEGFPHAQEFILMDPRYEPGHGHEIYKGAEPLGWWLTELHRQLPEAELLAARIDPASSQRFTFNLQWGDRALTIQVGLQRIEQEPPASLVTGAGVVVMDTFTQNVELLGAMYSLISPRWLNHVLGRWVREGGYVVGRHDGAYVRVLSPAIMGLRAVASPAEEPALLNRQAYIYRKVRTIPTSQLRARLTLDRGLAQLKPRRMGRSRRAEIKAQLLRLQEAGERTFGGRIGTYETSRGERLTAVARDKLPQMTQTVFDEKGISFVQIAPDMASVQFALLSEDKKQVIGGVEFLPQGPGDPHEATVDIWVSRLRAMLRGTRGTERALIRQVWLAPGMAGQGYLSEVLDAFFVYATQRGFTDFALEGSSNPWVPLWLDNLHGFEPDQQPQGLVAVVGVGDKGPSGKVALGLPGVFSRELLRAGRADPELLGQFEIVEPPAPGEPEWLPVFLHTTYRLTDRARFEERVAAARSRFIFGDPPAENLFTVETREGRTQIHVTPPGLSFPTPAATQPTVSEQRIQQVRELLQAYPDPRVKAVLVFGSVAAGAAAADSDLDYAVLTDRGSIIDPLEHLDWEQAFRRHMLDGLDFAVETGSAMSPLVLRGEADRQPHETLDRQIHQWFVKTHDVNRWASGFVGDHWRIVGRTEQDEKALTQLIRERIAAVRERVETEAGSIRPGGRWPWLQPPVYDRITIWLAPYLGWPRARRLGHDIAPAAVEVGVVVLCDSLLGYLVGWAGGWHATRFARLAVELFVLHHVLHLLPENTLTALKWAREEPGLTLSAFSTWLREHLFDRREWFTPQDIREAAFRTDQLLMSVAGLGLYCLLVLWTGQESAAGLFTALFLPHVLGNVLDSRRLQASITTDAATLKASLGDMAAQIFADDEALMRPRWLSSNLLRSFALEIEPSVKRFHDNIVDYLLGRRARYGKELMEHARTLLGAIEYFHAAQDTRTLARVQRRLAGLEQVIQQLEEGLAPDATELAPTKPWQQLFDTWPGIAIRGAGVAFAMLWWATGLSVGWITLWTLLFAAQWTWMTHVFRRTNAGWWGQSRWWRVQHVAELIALGLSVPWALALFLSPSRELGGLGLMVFGTLAALFARTLQQEQRDNDGRPIPPWVPWLHLVVAGVWIVAGIRFLEPVVTAWFHERLQFRPGPANWFAPFGVLVLGILRDRLVSLAGFRVRREKRLETLREQLQALERASGAPTLITTAESYLRSLRARLEPEVRAGGWDPQGKIDVYQLLAACDRALRHMKAQAGGRLARARNTLKRTGVAILLLGSLAMMSGCAWQPGTAVGEWLLLLLAALSAGAFAMAAHHGIFHGAVRRFHALRHRFGFFRRSHRRAENAHVPAVLTAQRLPRVGAGMRKVVYGTDALAVTRNRSFNESLALMLIRRFMRLLGRVASPTSRFGLPPAIWLGARYRDGLMRPATIVQRALIPVVRVVLSVLPAFLVRRMATVQDIRRYRRRDIHGRWVVAQRLAGTGLVLERTAIPPTWISIEGWPWRFRATSYAPRVDRTVAQQLNDVASTRNPKELHDWFEQLLAFHEALWQRGIYTPFKLSNFGIWQGRIVLLDYGELWDDPLVIRRMLTTERRKHWRAFARELPPQITKQLAQYLDQRVHPTAVRALWPTPDDPRWDRQLQSAGAFFIPLLAGDESFLARLSNAWWLLPLILVAGVIWNHRRHVSIAWNRQSSDHSSGAQLPWLARAWLWVYRRWADGFVRLEGLEHLPPRGTNLVLAGNHISAADAWLMTSALLTREGRHPIFVTSPRRHIAQWLLRHGLVIPREEGGTVERMVEFLQQPGRELAVFPARRGREEGIPALNDWRTGVAAAARETGSPIVPFVLSGRLPFHWSPTHMLAALLRWWALRSHVPPFELTVTFGPPIPTADRSIDDIMADLRRAMSVLLAGKTINGTSIPMPAPPDDDDHRALPPPQKIWEVGPHVVSLTFRSLADYAKFLRLAAIAGDRLPRRLQIYVREKRLSVRERKRAERMDLDEADETQLAEDVIQYALDNPNGIHPIWWHFGIDEIVEILKALYRGKSSVEEARDQLLVVSRNYSALYKLPEAWIDDALAIALDRAHRAAGLRRASAFHRARHWSWQRRKPLLLGLGKAGLLGLVILASLWWLPYVAAAADVALLLWLLGLNSVARSVMWFSPTRRYVFWAPDQFTRFFRHGVPPFVRQLGFKVGRFFITYPAVSELNARIRALKGTPYEVPVEFYEAKGRIPALEYFDRFVRAGELPIARPAIRWGHDAVHEEDVFLNGLGAAAFPKSFAAAVRQEGSCFMQVHDAILAAPGPEELQVVRAAAQEALLEMAQGLHQATEDMVQEAESDVDPKNPSLSFSWLFTYSPITPQRIRSHLQVLLELLQQHRDTPRPEAQQVVGSLIARIEEQLAQPLPTVDARQARREFNIKFGRWHAVYGQLKEALAALMSAVDEAPKATNPLEALKALDPLSRAAWDEVAGIDEVRASLQFHELKSAFGLWDAMLHQATQHVRSSPDVAVQQAVLSALKGNASGLLEQMHRQASTLENMAETHPASIGWLYYPTAGLWKRLTGKDLLPEDYATGPGPLLETLVFKVILISGVAKLLAVCLGWDEGVATAVMFVAYPFIFSFGHGRTVWDWTIGEPGQPWIPADRSKVIDRAERFTRGRPVGYLPHRPGISINALRPMEIPWLGKKRGQLFRAALWIGLPYLAVISLAHAANVSLFSHLMLIGVGASLSTIVHWWYNDQFTRRRNWPVATMMNDGAGWRRGSTSLSTFDLSHYNPLPQHPKHLIVHPDEFFDIGQTARTGIERLMTNICQGPGCNFEIPGSGGRRDGQRFPSSYLQHDAPQLATEADEARLAAFIDGAEEIILTGGGYEACHFTWFAEVLRRRLRDHRRTVIHIPLDAVYPRYEQLSTRHIMHSRYAQAFEHPYISGGLLELHEEIKERRIDPNVRVGYRKVDAAIFYNGRLISKTSEHPHVIVNYWDSSQQWGMDPSSGTLSTRSQGRVEMGALLPLARIFGIAGTAVWLVAAGLLRAGPAGWAPLGWVAASVGLLPLPVAWLLQHLFLGLETATLLWLIRPHGRRTPDVSISPDAGTNPIESSLRSMLLTAQSN